MQRLILLCTFFVLLFILSSCNPKCDTSLGVAATLSVAQAEAGMEVMIKTNPVDFLRNEDIFAQGPTGDKILLTSRFVPEQGVVVKMPADRFDTFDLLVEDADCGGMIPISGISTHDKAYFANNPNFVTPILPEIIIPSLPSLDPIDITNAWISPNNRAYCLWFGSFLRHFRSHPDGSPIDGDTSTVEIDTLYIPQDLDDSPRFLDDRSVELAVGPCTSNGAANSLFHNNPVSGMVDFKKNRIQIFIDRTSKVGINEVEEYEGKFISVNDVPEDLRDGYLRPGTCENGPNPGTGQRKELMVLTSKTTGHQMLLFKLIQAGD